MTPKAYSDESLLRAADAVRAFEKSDGMALFRIKAEMFRDECHRVLYARAADVPVTQYAEAAGGAKAVERLLGIFKQIQLEAEQLRNE